MVLLEKIMMIKKYALVFFFLLAYMFTWSNWLPQALTSRGISSIQVPGFLTLVSGYGPALAAIIVVSLTSGWQGLRELFGRLLRWRVGIQWYLIALFMPAFVILFAININNWTGGVAPDFSVANFPFGPAETPFLQKLVILFLVFTLGFDGLGEEIGWRGFALPKLLGRSFRAGFQPYSRRVMGCVAFPIRSHQRDFPVGSATLLVFHQPACTVHHLYVDIQQHEWKSPARASFPRGGEHNQQSISLSASCRIRFENILFHHRNKLCHRDGHFILDQWKFTVTETSCIAGKSCSDKILACPRVTL
jgi:membrane protease YdiL (CAAX protease family)